MEQLGKIRNDWNNRFLRSPTAEILIIASVAEEMEITPSKVRKLLITADFYSSRKSREVQELADQGLSLKEIAEQMGLTVASVCNYLPYSRGIYNLEDPTLYADQCRLFRKRKTACAELAKHMEEEQYLWQAIKAFENYPFRVQSGQKFTYHVREDRMCIDGVEFSREAIYRAFNRARMIQCTEGSVDRSERLECIGACELYTVFLRIGACQAKADKK